MTIDKELFYASHGLKYPVVARPYTDDMEVKEKFYTKADVMDMLTELKKEIEEKAIELCDDDGWWLTYNDIIQQKINSLKGEIC